MVNGLRSYVVLATTNKAAKLINGQTVHSFFGVDINGKYNTRLALSAARKYK